MLKFCAWDFVSVRFSHPRAAELLYDRQAGARVEADEPPAQALFGLGYTPDHARDLRGP